MARITLVFSLLLLGSVNVMGSRFQRPVKQHLNLMTMKEQHLENVDAHPVELMSKLSVMSQLMGVNASDVNDFFNSVSSNPSPQRNSVAIESPSAAQIHGGTGARDQAAQPHLEDPRVAELEALKAKEMDLEHQIQADTQAHSKKFNASALAGKHIRSVRRAFVEEIHNVRFNTSAPPGGDSKSRASLAHELQKEFSERIPDDEAPSEPADSPSTGVTKPPMPVGLVNMRGSQPSWRSVARTLPAAGQPSQHGVQSADVPQPDVPHHVAPQPDAQTPPQLLGATVPAAQASTSAAEALEKTLLYMANRSQPPADAVNTLAAGVAAKTGSRAGSAMRDAIEKIREEVDKIANEWQEARTGQQNLINTWEDKFHECAANRSASAGEAEAAKAAAETAHGTMITCRIQEDELHSGYQDCKGRMDDKQTIKDTECEAYTSARTPMEIPENLRRATSDAQWESWLSEVRDWATGKLAGSTDKHHLCGNATEHLEEVKEECIGPDGDGGKKRAHETKRQECNDKQHQFESYTCEHSDKVDEECRLNQECHNTVDGLWDVQKPILESQDQLRKEEKWMLERIRCYLDVFWQANGEYVSQTALNECKNAEHPVDPLDYFEVPAENRECTNDIVKPCSDEFMSQNYGSLPAGAPHEECQECVSTEV